MRWTTPVLLAVLAAGCAYHAPDAPTPVVITRPASTDPAAIRLTGSSRSDHGVDVIATVLTASGASVPGVNISLSTSAGSLSPTSGVTDGSGVFRSILSTGGAASVSAQVGTLTTTVTMLGSPDTTPPTTPAPAPLPPVTPNPAPLTVSISVAGSATAGTPTTFGLSTQALSSAVWTFGDGQTLTTSGTGLATHTYATGGSYPVGVNVTDTQGRTANTSTLVAVAAAAPAPLPPASSGLVITLGCTPATPPAATPCNVSASYNGTALPSAKITSVTWDWGDGSSGPSTAAATSHTYANVGTYPVFATVTATTDGGSITKTTSQSIVIK